MSLIDHLPIKINCTHSIAAYVCNVCDMLTLQADYIKFSNLHLIIMQKVQLIFSPMSVIFGHERKIRKYHNEKRHEQTKDNFNQTKTF